MKKFHDPLKNIYGATTLLSADGSTLLTDKEATYLEKVDKTFQ